MLRQVTGARRFNDRITLMRSDAVADAYGHRAMSKPVKVLECHAYVRQMSAAKTMLTFQQADVVGLEIEFRYTAKSFNVIEWHGHMVYFAHPENVDNRNMYLRVSGYYQTDNPTEYGGDSGY